MIRRHRRPGPLVGCKCVLAACLRIISVLWVGALAMCYPTPPLRPPCDPCVCVYVFAAYLRILSVLWIDELAMFSLTGWCVKKARPRSPLSAMLVQGGLPSSA